MLCSIFAFADLIGSDLLLERAEEALFQIADATRGMKGLTVAAGAPVRYENSLYNCAAIISDGQVLAIIPKTFIPNYSEFYENRWFTSGRDIKGRTLILREKLDNLNILIEQQTLDYRSLIANGVIKISESLPGIAR